MNELNPIRILRSRGLRGTLGQIKDKFLLREKYYYTCSLDSCPTQDQYKLVPASKTALEQLYKEHGDELSQGKYELLRQRLGSHTEQCLLITDSSSICGYCHIAYADHYNAWSNLRVSLEPGQVYLFDDYVFTNFRGKGLHKFSIAQRLHLAREKGFTTALTIIDKSNTPSHRAYASQGFQQTKRILHLPALKKNILRPL